MHKPASDLLPKHCYQVAVHVTAAGVNTCLLGRPGRIEGSLSRVMSGTGRTMLCVGELQEFQAQLPYERR